MYKPMNKCSAYAAFNDVMFEDVSDSILIVEDCLIELEPFGSFPVSEFRRAEYDDIVMTGGEI